MKHMKKHRSRPPSRETGAAQGWTASGPEKSARPLLREPSQSLGDDCEVRKNKNHRLLTRYLLSWNVPYILHFLNDCLLYSNIFSRNIPPFLQACKVNFVAARQLSVVTQVHFGQSAERGSRP